ncbi:MAG: diguanylate cyclase [Phycisphaerales bacterium]|nr:diguanylate cyclase [Phycisphaerales bacterium]
MTLSPGQPEPLNGTAHGWRIVLVGQSGLDRPLRRESDVELVRVRNGLEAIGELAHPIDGHSPLRSAVLLTPSAVDADELSALAEALRAVDPRVRVLGIGEGDGLWYRGAKERGAIDGTVRADADAQEVRAALHAARPKPTTTSAPTQPIDSLEPAPLEAQEQASTPAAPKPAPQRPVAAARGPVPSQSDADFDRRILAAMLRNGPAAPVCLAILREHFGTGAITWRPHGANTPPTPGRRIVAVRYHDAQLGAVEVDDSIDDAIAHDIAQWLAHWLALDEQQRQLRDAAFVDPLTGAWNRRFFEQHLDRVLAKAASARQHVTVLLLDVHDLKRFNDTYGHAAGDAVLRETTRLLTSCVRTNDRVCRVGGDEFVVVFWEPMGPRSPGSQTPRSVQELARRFQEKLASAAFPVLGHEAPGSLAVAGGMATYPWDGHNRVELMAHADALLRESKRSGTNAILFGPAGGGEPVKDGF